MNTTDMLLAQADAYECFWNAAIGTAHESQDSTAMAIASALSQGYAAIAARLREHASATPSSGEIIKDLEEKLDGLKASGLNSPLETQELPTLDAMRNASRGNATIGASALWLEARRVPHSSIVGSGVVFHDKRTGEAVAQIAVMVPNPKYDYRKVADPVIDRIIAKFNEVG